MAGAGLAGPSMFALGFNDRNIFVMTSPYIASPRPRNVLVGEGSGRGPFGRGKLIRPVNPEGPAQAKDEVYWEFYANFRCHDLALFVTSNQPGSVVRKVGQGIANREICGK